LLHSIIAEKVALDKERDVPEETEKHLDSRKHRVPRIFDVETKAELLRE
jgi:hypothetical protein